LPPLRLEVRHGNARPLLYEVTDLTFLIGSVPGCDLRLPGTNLPPVVCLIVRHAGGLSLRKLAPTQQVHVNGQPISLAALNDGDRITLGAVEMLVHSRTRALLQEPPTEPAPSRLPASLETARQQLQRQVQQFREQVTRFEEERQALQEREQKLQEQANELETDRLIWYRRREEIEQECQQQSQAATLRTQQLEERERQLETTRAEVEQRQQEMESRAAEMERQQQEMSALRQELNDARRDLYERYRQRRDRLAGLQEAVNRAARKVQARKQSVDAEILQLETRRQEQSARQAELDAREADLTRARHDLDEERQALEKRQQELNEEHSARLADCTTREAKLTQERQDLEKSRAQHQEDLVRLDRLQASLDERQKQLQARALEIDQRVEQMQRDSRDLEEQVVQLDQWHAKLCAQAEELNKQKAEEAEVTSRVAQRSAALEGQQAMLASLRTRLERMREELRREEQQLGEERSRQEALEADLQQRLQEAQQLREELDRDKTLLEQERRQFAERGRLLETAVAQLRQAREALAADEERIRQREEALTALTTEQTEEASLVRARSTQLAEMQERMEADRQMLRERTLALAQAEQAREALQEQLRRRSEELAAKQKALAEQLRQREEEAASVETRRAEIERQRQEGDEQLAVLRRELDQRQAELEQQKADLAQREETLRRNIERLKEAGRTVGAERKTLADERSQAEVKKDEALAAEAKAQAEAESTRQVLVALQQQLPELELRARAAVERLTQGREQLRGHLAEIHSYARQCQEDLEGLRAQAQDEAERLRQQEVALRRGQDEHRLAVAAFRQQLIDWQGQITEMKRLLAEDELRLQRRRAEVEQQARQVDATEERLAKQAEQLQVEQRAVVVRRGEVDRHLNDMREWYRQKLRELAGLDQESGVRSQETGVRGQGSGVRSQESEGGAGTAERPSILTLTDEIDPGDRQLGDLLRSLELVEADTLTALLVDARRQRRSLRQVLLASGAVTLYQMALIEAGNLDGLVLGPVRVIDRLRMTTRESVYRVFDPRRGQEAILRHLAEDEMLDAVHPDEFRQRFAAAAAVQHPHVAATLEVLEIAGRPAVLQELITGLPSPDWPSLTAVPGVWFRLVNQAALGLHTAHQAGLIHGHLEPGLVVLTGEGILKLCGYGEPQWLALPALPEPRDADVAADLAALGQLASSWIAPALRRKGARGKALPDALVPILNRLSTQSVEERYASAAALLEELDRAGAAIPANAEAWERLLRYVQEHATANAALRLSA
jgi:chromosome segregation ATPase